jgi:hypothetical protein
MQATLTMFITGQWQPARTRDKKSQNDKEDHISKNILHALCAPIPVVQAGSTACTACGPSPTLSVSVARRVPQHMNSNVD